MTLTLKYLMQWLICLLSFIFNIVFFINYRFLFNIDCLLKIDNFLLTTG